MASPDASAAALLAGDTRALARALSIVERQDEEAAALLGALFPRAGQAGIVGLTGPPGAGKSTLLRALAEHLLARARKVAVLAVDPTSAVSGGALLGDRLRLAELAPAANLYCRSLATRGAKGSLSAAAWDAVTVLDAAGYDPVFVETVGAGQNDLDIRALAHTVVWVDAPGLGDAIQALKAGLLEVSDLVVVNKSDRPDCLPTARRIRQTLRLGAAGRGPAPAWSVPVLTANALTGKDVPELWRQVEAHAAFLDGAGLRAQGNRRRHAHQVDALMAQAWQDVLSLFIAPGQREQALDAMALGRLDPHAAAWSLLDAAPWPRPIKDALRQARSGAPGQC